MNLKPVAPVRDPDADGVDELPGRDRRDVTDDRHEITLAARLHLQDREAGVLVVERHPLDGPDERFSGRGSVDRGLQKVGPERGTSAWVWSQYNGELPQLADAAEEKPSDGIDEMGFGLGFNLDSNFPVVTSTTTTIDIGLFRLATRPDAIASRRS